MYNPSNWYWFIGSDETKVWSSAKAAYVPAADADFVAFKAAGNLPTRIGSESDLRDVLTAVYPAGAGKLAGARLVRPSDFMARFTDAEIEALSTLGRTNVKAQAWVTRVLSAATIDLADATLSAKLDLLVTANVITAQRKTELLG